MKRKKKNNIFQVEVFFILIIISILIILPSIKNKKAGNENIVFEIKNGSNIKQIAKELNNEGIINNPQFFISLAKMLDMDTKIKSGEYLLQKDMYEYNVLMKLYKGEIKLRKLIIPEGFTIYQIASRVKKTFSIDSIAFIKECENKYFLKKYNIKGKNVEGYLFPDTYYFTKGISASQIIEKMLKRFNEQYPDTIFKKNNFGFGKHEYIILASMIEKEAILDREKPIIAGVYYNRLKKKMLLQCDATVLYALGEAGRIITYEECKIESKYNTYKYKGLPIGPICSPGKSSIDAALNPDKNKYLFYVANGHGGHIFSRTYKEHIRIQKHLK